MLEYEITEDTCALIAISELCTKVIELEEEKIINSSTLKIIDYNCKYYGSSYNGRREGSINILKNSYKIPVIIEESGNIIFFPISSPRYNNTTWISLKNIKSYKKVGKSTEIIFKNGKIILLKVSHSSFQNQILRSSYLEVIFSGRKINKMS